MEVAGGLSGRMLGVGLSLDYRFLRNAILINYFINYFRLPGPTQA
jgi:hypothetical protein